MSLMDYFKAEALLRRYGIRSVRSAYAESAHDAVRFANGKRIVLKAISRSALHKSKSGLVMADLDGEREIRLAYDALAKRAARYRPFRILAQRMAGEGGIEIIIGGRTDSQFGKLVLLGLGGVYVEAFRDFSVRVCPVGRAEAESMVMELRSRAVVAPNRRAVVMIANLIVRVSRLYSDNKISELDLNPVILHNGTYDAVDLRVIT
jgi:succinyl-CoA synthetase beta subunit